MLTPAGLTAREASARLQQVGPNALPVPRHRLLRLIGRQFGGVFNLLLLVAAGITFLLGEPVDGWFILLFVALGVSLSVFQEHKSNAAADKLRTYLLSTITVRRDGADTEVPTDRVVPGDLLRLEAGDIVPADSVVLDAWNLVVDETTFTGESVPVPKVATSGEPEDSNRLLQGVVVVRGNALAEVTATGARTRLAGISATATAVHAPSELVKGIDRISNFILVTTLITLGFVIAANLLIEGRTTDLPQLLVFAIALAVSVIPEALPLVLTFSLSRGALQFAERDVIVKRLSSVQDLGSINLLCTDKTGTITQNRLSLAASRREPGSGFDPVVLTRLAAIDLAARVPEPFDRAADAGLDAAQRAEVERFVLVAEEAFSPEERSNGAVVRGDDGVELHIRRGSPEYFLAQGIVGAESLDWLRQEEALGRRVLGVSYDLGAGPRFAGFASFVDRLKDTAAATIAAAGQLQVAITVITGDAVLVAAAVGRDAGLVTSDDQVVNAGEFLALPATHQRARVGEVRVFARTTPEQKLELIHLLKEQFTVGYLGEGINDAPALKAADVSMVVQSASDVARETADIVLVQNDLRVVVDGIRLGRETHANTLKYIRATLVSNFGNFYAVAVGSLLITFLPMLPKQLLLLNLLSDVPMMAVAFDRVSPRDVTRPQRYDFHGLYITFLTLGMVSTVFDFVYFGLFYSISPASLQTNWFIASVLTELLLVFSIRSMLPIEKAGPPAPVIVWLSVLAGALAIGLPLLPITAEFFEFRTPSPGDLALIVGLAALYLVVTEAVKRPLAGFLARQPESPRP